MPTLILLSEIFDMKNQYYEFFDSKLVLNYEMVVKLIVVDSTPILKSVLCHKQVSKLVSKPNWCLLLNTGLKKIQIAS